MLFPRPIIPGPRSHLGSTPRTILSNCRCLGSLRVVEPVLPPFGMRTRAESTKPAPVPRPSASLIVVNKRNEVLLVHRNPKATSYGGAHVSTHESWLCSPTYALIITKVFPGGNFDAKQDSCLEMTAIRETFEESGLLFASLGDSSKLGDHVLDEERQSIHAQRTNFQTFLAEHNLTADMSSLLPFTTWVTPASAPRSDAFNFHSLLVAYRSAGVSVLSFILGSSRRPLQQDSHRGTSRSAFQLMTEVKKLCQLVSFIPPPQYKNFEMAKLNLCLLNTTSCLLSAISSTEARIPFSSGKKLRRFHGVHSAVW
jgi:8-oxo-dGTP pyrophosphatase MutT (NUDIX family)